MKPTLCVAFLILAVNFVQAETVPMPPDFDATAAERFANLALACVHKEYPNKISHSLNSDADVAPPRKLTPAFYGCYDWHSSVHGHWLLARLIRTFPDAHIRARRARSSATKLDARKHRSGSSLPAGRGTRQLRTSLWTGMAAATGCGVEGVGRSAGPRTGGELASAWKRLRSCA